MEKTRGGGKGERHRSRERLVRMKYTTGEETNNSTDSQSHLLQPLVCAQAAV